MELKDGSDSTVSEQLWETYLSLKYGDQEKPGIVCSSVAIEQLQPKTVDRWLKLWKRSKFDNMKKFIQWMLQFSKDEQGGTTAEEKSFMSSMKSPSIVCQSSSQCTESSSKQVGSSFVAVSSENTAGTTVMAGGSTSTPLGNRLFNAPIVVKATVNGHTELTAGEMPVGDNVSPAVEEIVPVESAALQVGNTVVVEGSSEMTFGHQMNEESSYPLIVPVSIVEEASPPRDTKWKLTGRQSKAATSRKRTKPVVRYEDTEVTFDTEHCYELNVTLIGSSTYDDAFHVLHNTLSQGNITPSNLEEMAKTNGMMCMSRSSGDPAQDEIGLVRLANVSVRETSCSVRERAADQPPPQNIEMVLSRTALPHVFTLVVPGLIQKTVKRARPCPQYTTYKKEDTSNKILLCHGCDKYVANAQMMKKHKLECTGAGTSSNETAFYGIAGTTCSLPGTSGSFPGAAGSLPGTTGSLPGTTGSLPGTAGSLPGTAGSLRGIVGSLCGTAASLRGTAGSLSGFTSTLPGTAGILAGCAGAPGTSGFDANKSSGSYVTAAQPEYVSCSPNATGSTTDGYPHEDNGATAAGTASTSDSYTYSGATGTGSTTEEYIYAAVGTGTGYSTAAATKAGPSRSTASYSNIGPGESSPVTHRPTRNVFNRVKRNKRLRQAMKGPLYSCRECGRRHRNPDRCTGQCPYCGVSNHSSFNKSDHIRKCHPEVVSGCEHVCDNCGHCSATLAGHLIHVANCSKLTRCLRCGHICKLLEMSEHFQECLEKFGGKSGELKVQVIRVCHLCRQETPTRRSLVKHLAQEHKAVERYVCSTCGRDFNSSYELASHVSASHTLRQCSFCPKSFVKNKALSEHLRKWHGSSPECRPCGRRFNDEAARHRHVLRCGRRQAIITVFPPSHKWQDQPSTSQGVTSPGAAAPRPQASRHPKGEKKSTSRVKEPPVCCGTVFHSKDDLKKHFLVQKLHHCEVCEKRFASFHNLKMHRAKVHLQKRYTCQYCQQQFAFPYEILNHKRVKHHLLLTTGDTPLEKLLYDNNATYVNISASGETLLDLGANGIKHSRSVSRSVREKDTCGVCGAQVVKGYLRNHYRFAHPDLPDELAIA